MLHRFFACLAVVALATGCDTTTSGSKGVESFSFQSSQCAIFSCGLDNAALQGSRVTIQATGGDPALRPTANLASAKLGAVASQSETCSCQVGSDENTTRPIDPTATCQSSETKSCILTIDVDTTAAGDDTLEIHEPNGALRDSITLHVHPAARIDIQLSTASDDANIAAAGGVYTVHAGANLILHSSVYDGAGKQLVFSEHGVSFAYGDKTLLAPTANLIGGATGRGVHDPARGRRHAGRRHGGGSLGDGEAPHRAVTLLNRFASGL